jgi:hypothetical protein
MRPITPVQWEDFGRLLVTPTFGGAQPREGRGWRFVLMMKVKRKEECEAWFAIANQ